MRPPSALIHALASARARIFGTTPPRAPGAPGATVRTGAKYLRRQIQGPTLLGYYESTPQLKMISQTIFGPGGAREGEHWIAPDGQRRNDVVTDKEFLRLEKVEKQKRKGKPPPRKGSGRRAMLKAKKRK